MEDAGVLVERAAALVLPRARHGRNAGRGVHRHRAIARAGKTVAEPEKRARRRADHLGEGFDFSDGQPGDGRRPFRRAGPHMRFKPGSVIRVLGEVGAVGMPITEQHVHDRASQRGVGTGLQAQGDVGLIHRAVLVNVDGDDLGPPLLPRFDRVGHDVDLRIHGIGTPDHDQVAFGHFLRVGPAWCAGARHPSGFSERGADRRVPAGIAFGVPEAVNAVAHDKAHGPRIEVWPHAFRAMLVLGLQHRGRRNVECLVPGNALEFARSFRADAA